jgi:hypothetical protein
LTTGDDVNSVSDTYVHDVVHNGKTVRRQLRVRMSSRHYQDLAEWGRPQLGVGRLHWVGDAADALGRLARMEDDAGWERFFEVFPLEEWVGARADAKPKESWY